MYQHIRNAISFIGSIVFVFGGIYLVDQYSGWRPFEDRVAATAIKESTDAVSPMAEGGSANHQVSNDYSGTQGEAATTPGLNRVSRCMDGKTRNSSERCRDSKAQGR